MVKVLGLISNKTKKKKGEITVNLSLYSVIVFW